MPPRALVRRLIAVLLLSAASAKAWAAFSSSPWDARGLETPLVSLLVILWEFGLACWLWSGHSAGASWSFTFGSFAGFALFSLRTAWLGIATCGCFGKIDVNPWITFGVDVAVLAGLLLVRPSWPTLAVETIQVGRAFARCVAVAGLFLGAVYLGAVGMFGTWHRAAATVRGEVVTVSQHTGSGSLPAGEEVTFVFVVSNHSGEAVRVYGGSTDCSCQTAMDLPLDIAPEEQREVSVRLRLPQTTGMFRRRIYLLTDHKQAQRIEATFSCRVINAAE